jgi:hypothetical protein
MRVLDAVADDLVVADRSVSGSKPPIGPGTARDLTSNQRYGPRTQTLLRVLASGGARAAFFAAGEHFAGLPGALAGIIGSDAVRGVTSELQTAREEEIRKLIVDAVLDPQQARILLTKATPENMPILRQRLTRRMLQTGIGATVSAGQ